MTRSWTRCLVAIAGLAAACSDDGLSAIDEEADARVTEGPADAGVTDATETETETGAAGNGNAGGIVPIDFDGGEANGALVKPVIALQSGAPGFTVLRAFASRHSAEIVTGFTDSLAEVRNDSPRTRCYLSVTIVLRSADGIVLDSDLSWVNGSVRAGEAAATCLGPGERGWVFGIHDAVYERVASVEIVFEEGLERVEVPAARLSAESAEALVSELTSRLRMVFRNQSEARARVDAVVVGDWLMFDGENPVAWGLFQSCNDAVVIPLDPGDAAEICGFALFRGYATSIQGWVAFEDIDSAARGRDPWVLAYRAHRAALQQRLAERRAVTQVPSR
jgi:hypothetical protein